MASFISEFLKPEISPEPYVPESDVVAYKECKDEPVIVEVYCHENGAYGFRYNSWVAWRDAGCEVRSHDWNLTYPPITTYSEKLESVIEAAELDAKENSLNTCGGWMYAV
ncbi:hypothetical protein [Microbulbifer taiwanensis]|uniref:Uncharacterized protein n=1 Tax=Microbulbifer taiwanensis TaxID=986746 RepID=A0ABW1YLR1_9GAMM|nr:hypothetical protein [Microbulbifer taiwanensis]